MENEAQLLIKINDFGKGNMDNLKRYMYNELSLIHMHQVNDFRLDADVKRFRISELVEYTADKEADITLVYFVDSVCFAKKYELKYGLTTSIKPAMFGKDFNDILVQENKNTEDGFFYSLCELIDKHSEEQSTLPTIGDNIEINTIICSDEDVLDWYEEQEIKTLKVNHIDYQTGRVFVDNCEFGIDINEVTISN